MFKQGDWSHTDGQFMVNTQKFNYEAVEEAETARSLLSRTWLEMLVWGYSVCACVCHCQAVCFCFCENLKVRWRMRKKKVRTKRMLEEQQRCLMYMTTRNRVCTRGFTATNLFLWTTKYQANCLLCVTACMWVYENVMGCKWMLELMGITYRDQRSDEKIFW